MLERRRATFKNGCIVVVQRWFNGFSTLDTTVLSVLCNVENSTSDFVSFSTFCFHCCFSLMIHAVETKLIRRWNVGWVVSIKKLILRNILSATLPTKWNVLIFFKDSAKTFTTPVLTNFVWWLLLRIRLRLVVSSSSGLQQVPS